MGNVRFIDATGIMPIEQMIIDFKRHDAIVLLVELRPNAREAPVQACFINEWRFNALVASSYWTGAATAS
jgi:hypothetical protein